MSLCKSLERIAQFWFNPSKVYKPTKNSIEEKKFLKKYNAPFTENNFPSGNNSRSETNSHLKNSSHIENKHLT